MSDITNKDFFHHIAEKCVLDYSHHTSGEKYEYILCQINSQNYKIEIDENTKIATFSLGDTVLFERLLHTHDDEIILHVQILAHDIAHIKLCCNCGQKYTFTSVCNDCLTEKQNNIFELHTCDICTVTQINKNMHTPPCCKKSEIKKRLCTKCLKKAFKCPFCRNKEKYQKFRGKHFYD